MSMISSDVVCFDKTLNTLIKYLTEHNNKMVQVVQELLYWGRVKFVETFTVKTSTKSKRAMWLETFQQYF